MRLFLKNLNKIPPEILDFFDFSRTTCFENLQAFERNQHEREINIEIEWMDCSATN